MDTAIHSLESMGVSKEQIHKESFFTDIDAKEEALKAAGKLAELTRKLRLSSTVKAIILKYLPENYFGSRFGQGCGYALQLSKRTMYSM